MLFRPDPTCFQQRRDESLQRCGYRISCTAIGPSTSTIRISFLLFILLPRIILVTADVVVWFGPIPDCVLFVRVLAPPLLCELERSCCHCMTDDRVNYALVEYNGSKMPPSCNGGVLTSATRMMATSGRSNAAATGTCSQRARRLHGAFR